MWEDIALWVIVIQGFFVMYFEYDVWRIKRTRENERAVWREQKRKQASTKAAKFPEGTIPGDPKL